MKRAALYVRVSTQEQKKYGFSVDNQIDALQKYCSENGYLIAGIYNDAGISARKAYNKRPELLRLLDDCRAGAVDVILFTRLDRWFRSVGDYYEIQRVLDQKKVTWRAIWEDYNTDDSAGVFKVNIMLSVAQAEADRTSEKIRAVNEYRREVKKEYTSGKAPTGYIVRRSQLSKDPETAEAVAAFFEEYLTSFNVTYAVKILHSYGVNVRRDTARRMLNNTAYYGDASGYECDPYITRADYEKIQQHLPQKARATKDPDRVYLFSGLLVCADCGTRLHGSVRYLASGKNTRAYKYYRCPKNRNMACDMARSKSEAAIERDLIASIDSAMRAYNAQLEEIDVEAVDNTKKIANLQDRLTRLADLYELGDISRDQYISRKKAINREISELQAPPIAHEKKALPDDWQEIYHSLSDAGKKAFWCNVIRSASMDSEGRIRINF